MAIHFGMIICICLVLLPYGDSPNTSDISFPAVYKTGVELHQMRHEPLNENEIDADGSASITGPENPTV